MVIYGSSVMVPHCNC